MTGDVVVNLADGVYRLSAPLELTPQDSGRNGFKVVYQAAPGARPLLSGGRAVTGWQLFDAGRNLYRAPVPAGTQSRQFYVDGMRAVRARSELNPPGFTKVAASGFASTDPAYASWPNPTDMEIVTRHAWKHLRCPVASITASGTGSQLNAVNPCWANGGTPNNPNNYFPYNGSGFVDMKRVSWLENALPLLDQPGEWYLDRSAGYVYYMPRAGEDLASADTELAVAESLVEMTGTPGHLDVVNDNDTRAAYTGSWTVSAKRDYGDVGDDVHSTSTNGDAVELSFTGTGIDVLGERFTDLGDIDVYVDGQFDRTVSAQGAAPRLAQQVVYSRTGLAKGPHTVRLVKKSGQSMVIDGFSVVPEVIEPVHDIALRGITFGYATWLQPSGPEGYADNQAGVVWVGTPQRIAKIPGAVRVTRGQRIEISQSEFGRIGGTAVEFGNGTQDSKLVGNRITDISGAGVSVGEFDDHWLTDPNRQTARITVSDNYISDVGREFEDVAGVSVGYTRNASVEHNEISRTPYSGISLGWGWGWDSPYNDKNGRHGTNYAQSNRIVGNYVHDVMKVLEDGGPVYTLGGQGDGSARSVLSDNVFSKGGAEEEPYAKSIYHDEGSSWWDTHDNVVSQIGQHWNDEWTRSIHDITIHDNFIDDNRYQNNGTNVPMTNNTLVTDGAWPQRAKDIVAAAGVRAPYRNVVLPERLLVNDGELGPLLAPATISYTGSWTISRTRTYGDLNADVHFTTADGDSASITFTGTGIQVLGERNSDQGRLSVTLDGAAAGTVDTNAPTRVAQAVVYEVSGLPYGQHSVKLTKAGGTYAVIDGFRLDRSINEDDPAIGYSGSWATYANRGHGDFNDDVRATTENGASVTVPFVGTRIDVRTETNSDQGQVDVYIDGRYRKTIDTYAPSRSAQQSVFTADLPDGYHTLRLVKKSGQYLVVDRFTIR
ncbi:hypothetical protein ACFZDG_04450 [Kitasatospora xanthocidica]|uniref:hypothetical protein n=1 Tax=Kitasatospora xanthocidica TaxID=83382 RepID=UPI0036E33A6A